jgi:hypothetical protein
LVIAAFARIAIELGAEAEETVFQLVQHKLSRERPRRRNRRKG